MIKKGFTLAEILVALSVIGIVVALTMPTFTAESRNKANATKLATVVSDLENAFASMIVEEGVQDLSETQFVANPREANLSNYFRTNGSADNYVEFYSDRSPFRTLSGANTGTNQTISFKTKNGAYLIYNGNIVNITDADVQRLGGSVSGSIGRLTIDVNGNSRPNIWGRDVFYFRIGNDGLLYPAGGLNYAILEKGDNTSLWNRNAIGENDFMCNDALKTQGCTARLIENNYEVDY